MRHTPDWTLSKEKDCRGDHLSQKKKDKGTYGGRLLTIFLLDSVKGQQLISYYFSLHTGLNTKDRKNKRNLFQAGL